jgi:surface protein
MPKGTRKTRKIKGGETVITDDNIRDLVKKYIINKRGLPEDLRTVPIGNWDVSRVTDMKGLFTIPSPNLSMDPRVLSVLTEKDMYLGYNFNEDISQWDVSNVTNMEKMFVGKFNQPIGAWNVSKVTNMKSMFFGAISFNQPIGSWNVSNVKDMNSMFRNAKSFNQPIDTWNVSNVEDMAFMFSRATVFNQPIGSWDVSKVTNMKYMFSIATAFNQPIGSWNVSNVTNMEFMFSRATVFNQPIGSWNVSNVEDMAYMFDGATVFNQPLNQWNIKNVRNVEKMFSGSAMSPKNYPGVEVEEPPEVLLRRLGYSEQAIKFILDDKTYDDDFVEYVEKIQNDTGTDYIDAASQTLMIDPVIASDNHIYERETLKRLLTLNPTNRKSAFTREILTGNPNELIPAVELRSQVNELINKYIMEHPEQSAGRRRMTRKRKNARRFRKSKKVRGNRK